MKKLSLVLMMIVAITGLILWKVVIVLLIILKGLSSILITGPLCESCYDAFGVAMVACKKVLSGNDCYNKLSPGELFDL